MQPPVTAVEQNDHAAAAAYLMKRAGATALIVTKMPAGQPTGIITEADISRAVADGKNPNDVRIYERTASSVASIDWLEISEEIPPLLRLVEISPSRCDPSPLVWAVLSSWRRVQWHEHIDVGWTQASPFIR
jgi:CBS domain-containing protein